MRDAVENITLSVEEGRQFFPDGNKPHTEMRLRHKHKQVYKHERIGKLGYFIPVAEINDERQCNHYRKHLQQPVATGKRLDGRPYNSRDKNPAEHFQVITHCRLYTMQSSEFITNG